MAVSFQGPAAIVASSTFTSSRAVQLHWILRLGAAFCFIGHGAFGLITKSAWLPFFLAFGISADLAYQIMPFVGVVDIGVGLALLWRPRPALLVYMTFWALFTALLRPLTGMNAFEFLERAGNYGVPLAFLLLTGLPSLSATPSRWKTWLRPIHIAEPHTDRMAHAEWALRISVAALMIGHGGLAIGLKPLLVDHLAWLGVTQVVAFGWFEVAIGALIILLPLRPVVFFVFVWKVSTELLFPLTGDWVWEFVERAGSYAGPLALFMLLTWRGRSNTPRLGKSHALPLGLLFALLPASGGAVDAPDEGLRIYIVRHAQTVANVTRMHTLANQRTFSKQGLREIAALDEKLAGIDFDHVLVSPLWRNQYTIAPYLRNTGQTAEIWPELEECCWQRPKSAPPSNVIPRGEKIRLGTDVRELFKLRSGDVGQYYFNAQTFADSVLQVDVALRRLRDRFGDKRETILLITHFATSARLIAGLLDDDDALALSIDTATLNLVRKRPNGGFELVMLNDAPFEGEY